MKNETKRKIKQTVKKVLQFLLNPRLLLCFAIAWFLTNGWCYLFIFLGMLLDVTWMYVVGGTWAAVLWFPFTPEKIVTIFITIFLLRTLFPKDEKTLRVLREELAVLRAKLKSAKEKRRAKRLAKQVAARRKKKNEKG